MAPAAAARRARLAAHAFTVAGQPIESGRARLFAGLAHAEINEPARARDQLGHAIEIFAACNARRLHAQTLREASRLG